MKKSSSKLEGNGSAVMMGALGLTLMVAPAVKEFCKEVGKKVGSKVGDKICDLIGNKEKSKDK